MHELCDNKSVVRLNRWIENEYMYTRRIQKNKTKRCSSNNEMWYTYVLYTVCIQAHGKYNINTHRMQTWVDRLYESRHRIHCITFRSIFVRRILYANWEINSNCNNNGPQWQWPTIAEMVGIKRAGKLTQIELIRYLIKWKLLVDANSSKNIIIIIINHIQYTILPVPHWNWIRIVVTCDMWCGQFDGADIVDIFHEKHVGSCEIVIHYDDDSVWLAAQHTYFVYYLCADYSGMRRQTVVQCALITDMKWIMNGSKPLIRFYILAECDRDIASAQCNGWSNVRYCMHRHRHRFDFGNWFVSP